MLASMPNFLLSQTAIAASFAKCFGSYSQIVSKLNTKETRL